MKTIILLAFLSSCAIAQAETIILSFWATRTDGRTLGNAEETRAAYWITMSELADDLHVDVTASRVLFYPKTFCLSEPASCYQRYPIDPTFQNVSIIDTRLVDSSANLLHGQLSIPLEEFNQEPGFNVWILEATVTANGHEHSMIAQGVVVPEPSSLPICFVGLLAIRFCRSSRPRRH